jgi:O-antigen/teichoic acid export membrane protein
METITFVRLFRRTLPLFVDSAFSTVIPFIRTLILTHLLAPYEFGFASALAATFATFELITDIAITNFVFSSPRSVYSQAIAGAHAVSIMRGFCVACFVLLASKPVACTLATCGDWPSFAWLAFPTFILSFSHLEIRVKATRDYQYWPPAVALIASHGCGLLALFLVTYKFENQYGYIAYWLAQAPVSVLASHLLASNRYSVNYRTPFVRKSLAFGLPLLLNGVGLAIMSQGDRWIVGSLLGLPSLGLYSLITLSAFVPLTALYKLMSPIQFAGLHNAKVETGEYDARLKLYSRTVPAVAAFFAISIIALYDRLIPGIFGQRYTVSDSMIFLLAMIAYVRIIRTDPQTSLLFNAQDTHKLAIAGQAPFIGLLLTAGLVIIHPTLETVLVGGLVGEIAGLCAIGYVVGRLFRSALYDHVFSALAMFAVVVGAGVAMLSIRSSDVFADRIAIGGVFLILVVVYAGLSLPGLYKLAYRVR